MKIKIAKQNLETILNSLSRIISVKPQLPILNCLLFEAKNGKISLFATDLNLGIKSNVFGEIIEEGVISVPVKLFLEVIKSLSSGDIEITLKDLSLEIKSGKTKTSIQCQSGEDFPVFPSLPTLTSEIDSQKLKIIEKYVSFSTSLDQTRVVLTTLLFRKKEDGIQVVGTDGFRLSVLSFSEEIIKGFEGFLITNKAFSEVVRLSEQQNTEKVLFEVSNEFKQVFFKVGESEMFVRLIESTFPPFEKIIPPDFETTISFDGEEFENVLRQATIFARETSNIVTLEILEKSLKINAAASSRGDFEGEIAVENISGLAGKVSFNVKYLQDLLKNVRPKQIWMGMNDSLKPVMFKEIDNDHYQYIVMPFRLNG